jgi:hypothetical protein
MSKESDSTRIQLFLGILGFIGVLLGVFATIFAPIIQERLRQNNPTQALTPIVISTNTEIPSPLPTDTTLPGEPTSTPAPPTDTPTPTLTRIPAVLIGQDWGASCISTLWQPYPANVPMIDGGNGCWKQPVLIYSAANGSLSFQYQRGGSGPVEIFGLFAPLPETGTATYKIHFTDLSNADILMGVFASADVNSQGLLLAIPNSNSKKRVIVQKDNVVTYNTLQSTNTLDQGGGFTFTFTFTTNSASGSVNSNVFVTNPVSLSTTQKWLFLGYKGLDGKYSVSGEFSGLEIK